MKWPQYMSGNWDKDASEIIISVNHDHSYMAETSTKEERTCLSYIAIPTMLSHNPSLNKKRLKQLKCLYFSTVATYSLLDIKEEQFPLIGSKITWFQVKRSCCLLNNCEVKSAAVATTAGLQRYKKSITQPFNENTQAPGHQHFVWWLPHDLKHHLELWSRHNPTAKMTISMNR